MRSRRGRAASGRRRAAAAAAAAAAVAAWAVLVEPRLLRVRERELRLPRWPVALDGLRVALVGDLHAGGPQAGLAAVARVARRASARRPDLVVVLGDLVDPHVVGGEPVAPEAVAAALAELGAPLGTVAVLGNHDWMTDGPRVAAALRGAGLAVLENEAVPVAPLLWVAGLGDASTRPVDLDAALAAVPEDAGVLLLSHDPDVFPRVPARVALTLAGHTHGGQVDVPVLRRRVIPSRFGERYARGHVVEGGRHLFVTSGIGTSRWPVRLRRPPEVVILRLRHG